MMKAKKNRNRNRNNSMRLVFSALQLIVLPQRKEQFPMVVG